MRTLGSTAAAPSLKTMSAVRVGLDLMEQPSRVCVYFFPPDQSREWDTDIVLKPCPQTEEASSCKHTVQERQGYDGVAEVERIGIVALAFLNDALHLLHTHIGSARCRLSNGLGLTVPIVHDPRHPKRQAHKHQQHAQADRAGEGNPHPREEALDREGTLAAAGVAIAQAAVRGDIRGGGREAIASIALARCSSAATVAAIPRKVAEQARRAHKDDNEGGVHG